MPDMNFIEELLDLIEKSGRKPCFWFGLPPCPKCKRDHGDPKCAIEKDKEIRKLIKDAQENM